MIIKILSTIPAVIFTLSLIGCDSDGSNTTAELEKVTESNISLQFKPIAGDMEVNCNDIISGIGANTALSVGVGDVRFFVSNIKFYDSADQEIGFVMDGNEFQLNHSEGAVALVDFTGNDSDYCDIISEGTMRTNTSITGTVTNDAIAAVRFDVGLPQAVMKSVIAAGSLEDAPSPLGELVWSWAGGYRHFVVNFTTMDAAHTDMVENGAVHIGSTDCGTGEGHGHGGGGNALEHKDACGKLNTAKVMLSRFDPSTHTVTVDIKTLLAGIQEVDVMSPDWQPHNGDESICINEHRNGDYCVVGTTFAIQCHSGATQSACPSLMSSLGIDMNTGVADSTNNTVFGME